MALLSTVSFTGCGLKGGKSDTTVLSTDLPPAPTWATALLGKPAPAAAPNAQCLGYADRVVANYKGARSGVTLAGWSWDVDAHKPFSRIIIVEPSGTVIGAGSAGGDPRPDVMAAKAGVVTTPQSGWIATAAVTSGAIKAFGLTDAGETCAIGGLKVTS